MIDRDLAVFAALAVLVVDGTKGRIDVDGHLHAPGYEGFSISASMPVQASAHLGRLPYDFLTNLLPEGDRRRLARQHRLDPDDSFGLVGALGRECAGALQIVPDGESPEQVLRPTSR